MINALNVAHELHGMLPEEARPEHTEGYEGFFHLVGMSGDVAHTQLHYIIRDHDMRKFEDKKQLMEKCVGRINERYGDIVAAFQNVTSIDIVNHDCSKGKGVLILREALNIKRIAGIGDSMNDRPLIEAADISFTFPHAPADHIVGTVGEAISLFS